MIEEGLRAHLIADAGVAGYVGERVYHEILPQNPTLPAIVFSHVSDSRNGMLESPDPLITQRFSVDCYSTKSDSVKGLATAVRLSLNGLTGNLGGEPVDNVFLESSQDLSAFEGDKATRRVLLDFRIMSTEV